MLSFLFFLFVSVKNKCLETIYTNGDVLDNKYKDCLTVTALHIDQTTTKIGAGAFENANNLALITSPEFIDGFEIDIYEDAFKNIKRDKR